MRVAFTGTRRGLSAKQSTELVNYLAQYACVITDVAHGCCIGADTEFHTLVRAVLPHTVRAHIYPSTYAKTRAPLPMDAYYLAAFADPMVRNQHIIDCCPDMLVVCPLQLVEQPRGGTWDTVKKARKMGMPMKFLWRF